MARSRARAARSVITTGTALIKPGSIVTEDESANPDSGSHPRLSTERIAQDFAARGVRSSIVRPGASVHGRGDHGFVPVLIEIARERGVSGYIGDGSNRWPAVHRLDAARLYRLALEEAPAGSVYQRSPTRACQPARSPRSSADT